MNIESNSNNSKNNNTSDNKYSITVVRDFTPNRVQKKLIDAICATVLNSHYANRYNNTYHTQKYTLLEIVTKLVFFLHKCTNWRDLGNGWENIYKHFIHFSEWNIITDTFDSLLLKYKIKRKFGHLKLVMTDTTIIINKGGVDKIKASAC